MFRRLSPMLIGVLLLVACGAPAAIPTSVPAAAAPTTAPAAIAPTVAPTVAAAEPTAAPTTAAAATVAPTTAAAAPTDASTAAPTTAAASGTLRKVTMAMAYIPNVQFAPFYVAVAKGYYAQVGLDVAFDYNYETDGVQRIAAGNIDFTTASGMSVLLARQQDVPIVTVATLYQQFPVVFFSKAKENITKASDMKGKTLGLPGRFGANYYGLLALLYANKMTESDINIQEIGFTQTQALLADQVEITVGYAMNEPIVLEQQGEKLNVIRVADNFPLTSDGIIANQKTIDSDPDLVKKFISATLKGFEYTVENPDDAFNISVTQIPELKDDATKKLQRQVLQDTIPYWQSDKTKTEGYGYTDPDTYAKTLTFMHDSKLLQKDVDVSKAFTNSFIK